MAKKNGPKPPHWYIQTCVDIGSPAMEIARTINEKIPRHKIRNLLERHGVENANQLVAKKAQIYKELGIKQEEVAKETRKDVEGALDDEGDTNDSGLKSGTNSNPPENRSRDQEPANLAEAESLKNNDLEDEFQEAFNTPPRKRTERQKYLLNGGKPIIITGNKHRPRDTEAKEQGLPFRVNIHTPPPSSNPPKAEV